MMPGVTSLPVALRSYRMIPLKTGTKLPDVKHATYDAAGRWDDGVDNFLGNGGRVGVFMGGLLVGLDIDVKIAYRDDSSNDTSMIMVTGMLDVDRLLAIAGMTGLPRTLQVQTPSGGTHYYFTQNPAFPVTQCTIGCLDVRAARNSYLAIGEGYEVTDDGDGRLAIMPEALARAIMSVPHNRSEPGVSGELVPRDGKYGDFNTAFNSALTTLKGTMIGLGWSEIEANDAIRSVNRSAPDPIDDAVLDQTVLRPKGWEQGQRLRESELEWARRQVGVEAEDEEQDRFLDLGTVKRLWTTDRYRQYQDMQQLEPPAREKLADVVAEPPPDWIIEGLMTAGLYGLAGPQEAGKSLLIRDWLDVVANGKAWRCFRAQPREVSYVISEGHFDLSERFTGIDMTNIYLFRQPVMLNNETAVDYFIKQHEGHDTGLVVFDIIYHMGVGDDNTMKDVKPVLQAGRRISYALNCAVVVVGHPGHNTGRRFRGTSIWRNWFDGEFHMADNRFTCEKHKYTRKEPIDWAYEVEWPGVKFLSEAEQTQQQALMFMISQGIEAVDRGDYASDAEMRRHLLTTYPHLNLNDNTVKTYTTRLRKKLREAS